MTQIADVVYERIEEIEQQKTALDTQLEALREIHEIARTRLNGGGTVPDPVAETSRPATARPTQPRGAQVADPPSRKPASRSSHKSSTRRAPVSSPPSKRGASQGPAPAGGGVKPRTTGSAEQRRAQLFALIDAAGVNGISQSELAKQSGLGNLGRYLDPLAAAKRIRLVGTASGSHGGRPSPIWAKVTSPEETPAAAVKPVEEVALQAAGVTDPPDMPKLDVRVLATLRELGPRKQYELNDNLGERDADVARALGRLCRADLVRLVKHGPGKPTYELTEV